MASLNCPVKFKGFSFSKLMGLIVSILKTLGALSVLSQHRYGGVCMTAYLGRLLSMQLRCFAPES